MNETATRPEPSRQNAIAIPAIVSVAVVSGAAGGQDAVAEIADVQVLAFERRAGLAHLRVEHHPHGARLRAHRQRDAEVADQRADDVAGPSAVGAAERRAAPQADAGGVDRFLAERAESLALERGGAVLDLAAGEERLQPVVGGARQHHAAQDLDALVAGQRGLNGGAAQKAVARLQQLGVRVRHPRGGGGPRRRVGQPVRQPARACSRARQLAPQRRAQRLDRRLVARLARRR